MSKFFRSVGFVWGVILLTDILILALIGATIWHLF